MNFADSEVVASIISKEGYDSTENLSDADLILLNTCSIREKAEITVRKRLESFNKLKRNNKNLNREGSVIVLKLTGPLKKPLIQGIN